MFEIQIGTPRIDDVKVPEADFAILLRFVCELIIRVSGAEILRVGEFPFVEFAEQAAAWLKAGATDDFDYVSMETSIRGPIYFHKVRLGAWMVGSNFPGKGPPVEVQHDDIRNGLASFLEETRIAVDAFGVDVRRFVETDGRK